MNLKVSCDEEIEQIDIVSGSKSSWIFVKWLSGLFGVVTPFYFHLCPTKRNWYTKLITALWLSLLLWSSLTFKWNKIYQLL